MSSQARRMAALGLEVVTNADWQNTVRRVVGIGEFLVSDAATDTLVTHALGSCIAVCIWDGAAGVGGLLHFLLPDSALNPERARNQPALFANTGLPALFQAAYALGLEKRRCRVRLVGGAEVTVTSIEGPLQVARRNLLAARNLLWRNGLFVESEATGGTIPRTVALRMSDGKIDVTSGRDLLHEL